MSDRAGWHQFRLHIVRPVLAHLELWSESAENLLVGTAAVESGLRRLDQDGSDDRLGPGIGVYQIEPRTHADVWDNFLGYRPPLASVVREFASQKWFFLDMHRELAGNLFYATAIARVIYYRVREPLPDARNVTALAYYWKHHYNTVRGKGTVEKFLTAYERAT